MTADGVILWVHLIGASVWVGGLITVGALVPALRSAGADRSQLQAMARQFGRVSWIAMTVAVLTGVMQVSRLAYEWSDEPIMRKVGLVVLAIGLAAAHQLTARRSSAAVRGALQGVILLLSLGILAAAVAL
ncbi:MAG TPA: hypothetical protein VLG28_03235 [Acidimicrobiia bacterium]|nr:hypothetical protein [Acidimicrobiia bacterium]